MSTNKLSITKKSIVITTLVLFTSVSFAFDLKDVGHAVDKSYKCKSDDQACKNKEHALAAVKVAAVVAAATYITKMIIKNRSKKVADEKKVVDDYKSAHGDLPEKATASTYTTKAEPGNVVSVGKPVVIQSDIVVVPGKEKKETVIQERFAIFDNEDHAKELKSLTKDVNDKTKTAGHYTNEFTFTLPEGLPQGVYPIKNTLLINGEEVQSSNNDLQLVMVIDQQGQSQMLALRN